MMATQSARRWGFLGALALVAIAALLFWWVRFGPSSPTVPHLILQREWTANAEFAGDVWAASVAADHDIILAVKEGAEAIDAVKEVRSGHAQFGVASADRILQENESGAGLVVLAAATYRSPVVFLTRIASGITGPDDLRGRTVGLQAGTNTDLVFHSMLRAKHISAKDVNIVESGWGTATFEDGTLDVLGAFEYDEPVSLDAKGIKYGIINPVDAGVDYVGTVYFAREGFVRDHDDQVQAFLDALVTGWRESLKNPDVAISKLIATFPSLAESAAKERESFDRGRPYFAGEDGILLYASPERWNSMAQDLISAGKLKSFDISRSVDYRFLERANSKR